MTTQEKKGQPMKDKTIGQMWGVKDFPFELCDKHGKIVYLETSDGSWERWEYDAEGKTVYFKVSDELRERWEFDAEGKVVYYENSTGAWGRWKYDDDGNELFYESSTGHIIDNRINPST